MKMHSQYEDIGNALKWALDPSCWWHAQVRSLPALAKRPEKIANLIAAFLRSSPRLVLNRTTPTTIEQKQADALLALCTSRCCTKDVRAQDEAAKVVRTFREWFSRLSVNQEKAVERWGGTEWVHAWAYGFIPYLQQRWKNWEGAHPSAALGFPFAEWQTKEGLSV